jgi:hypothetical protein
MLLMEGGWRRRERERKFRRGKGREKDKIYIENFI